MQILGYDSKAEPCASLGENAFEERLKKVFDMELGKDTSFWKQQIALL